MGKTTDLGDAFSAGASVVEASEHERQAVAKAIGLPDNYARMDSPASQGGGRRNSKERRASLKSMATESEDSSDEDGGVSFSRLSSTKSNLSSGSAADNDFEVEGTRLENMPNYIPEATGNANVVHDTSQRTTGPDQDTSKQLKASEKIGGEATKDTCDQQ